MDVVPTDKQIEQMRAFENVETIFLRLIIGRAACMFFKDEIVGKNDEELRALIVQRFSEK